MSTTPAFSSQDSTTSNTSPDAQKKTGPVDPYDLKDPEAVKQIKKRIDERWKTANHRRWLLEIPWLRQVLFFLDIQWNRIDYLGRTIQNLTLPNNFPRSITNKYAEVNGTLMTQLIQGDIPLNFVPATDDEEDTATSNICERVREVIDAEVDVRKKKRDLGFWVTLTGNGFIESEYDYDPVHGTVPVPMQQCDGCGTQSLPQTDAPPCPKCALGASAGMDAGPGTYSPAMDPETQQPVTQDIPIGKLKNNSLAPFEVYFDNLKRIGAQEQDWYFTPKSYEVEVAKQVFPDSAAKISEGMNEPMKPSRNYLIAIAYAGAYLSGTTGVGEASARESMRRQVTAWRFKEMPTPEFPEGLYAVRIGDEIVAAQPLPNRWGAGQLEGKPFLGLTQFYQELSGGAWAKARASRLVSIQARRNIVESNLQLTAQRCGSPKLMSPVGSGMKNVTGEAGQLVEYKPITFGGTSLAKPEYLEAALGNFAPLIQFIELLDNMQEKIAGTQSVSGGDTPPGVTAASALAFLNEKANQAISPLKEAWVEGWAQVTQYNIEVARQHWTDERVLAILGRNKEWEFQKFKAADLSGAVNVSPDYKAMFPKSQATERANIMQIIQMGILQPGQDPELVNTILERFGLTELKKSQANSILQAMREWDVFLTTQKPPVLKPIVQDAQLHLTQHKMDAATQEYELMDPALQSVWDAHIMATETAVMASMQPLGPPPGAGPGGPPSPPHAQGGHPGSQQGSQSGAAKGNLAQAAPIRKGESAADGGGATPPPV